MRHGRVEMGFLWSYQGLVIELMKMMIIMCGQPNKVESQDEQKAKQMKLPTNLG